MDKSNATDVGLEPTASALGGLRATIAPTGRYLDCAEFANQKIYIFCVRLTGMNYGHLISSVLINDHN